MGCWTPAADLAWLIDTTSLLTGAEPYLLMTRLLGWDLDAYQAWLVTTLTRLAAPTVQPPHPPADRRTSPRPPHAPQTTGAAGACHGGRAAPQMPPPMARQHQRSPLPSSPNPHKAGR